MSEEIIITKELHHIYPGNVHALRGIDLTIRKGERIAIIGENGGGKTTLVKHFNGLLKPTQGRVFVKGMDTLEHKTHEIVRYVGYVFQNPADQIFSSRVISEVEFGPKNLKYPKERIKELSEKALEITGLTEFREVHPYELQHVQRKFLCIASIIAMDPEVIILDEPSSGMDYNGIRKLKRIVKYLNEEENKTVIVVSHNMDLVADIAERTVVLYMGKIILDGKTKEVLSKADKLQIAGVNPPQITRVALKLSELGVPNRITQVEELAEHLLRIKKEKRNS